MAFSFNESKPNAGSPVRTMQSDLRKIRESKQPAKAVAEPAGKTKLEKPESPKVQVNNFFVSKKEIPPEPKAEPKIEPKKIVKKTEPLKVTIMPKSVPSAPVNQPASKPIAAAPIPVKKEEKTEIKKAEPAKKEPVIKPIPHYAPPAPAKKEDALSKEMSTAVKQEQNQTKPAPTAKIVPPPENIIRVAKEEKNPAAAGSVPVFRAPQVEAKPVPRPPATEKKPEIKKIVTGRPKEVPAMDDDAYLPPELRLYRNTRSAFRSPAFNSIVKKETPADIDKKIDIQPEEESLSPKPLRLRLIGIGTVGFILIVAALLYVYVFNKPQNPVINPPVTPTPSSVAQKKLPIANTIYIKNSPNYKQDLNNLKDNKEKSAVSAVSITVRSVPLTSDELLDGLGIIVPESVKNNFKSDNYYLLYFSQDNRLGLAFEIKENTNEQLMNDLKTWEDIKINATGTSAGSPMVNSLNPLLLGNFYEIKEKIGFSQTSYKGMTIRYLNLPDASRAIDYSLSKDFLIIATSKDDMGTVINEISGS